MSRVGPLIFPWLKRFVWMTVFFKIWQTLESAFKMDNLYVNTQEFTHCACHIPEGLLLCLSLC